MISYSIEYYVKADPSMTIHCESVDAKNVQSAKRKIEMKLAKQTNRFRPPSKQIHFVRIGILRAIINGYY